MSQACTYGLHHVRLPAQLDEAIDMLAGLVDSKHAILAVTRLPQAFNHLQSYVMQPHAHRRNRFSPNLVLERIMSQQTQVEQLPELS